ncbi:aquaporin-like protein, partial [Gyrodon lividus]
MGFSLLVTAWLFFRVTGGLFNPNITLALWLVGVVGPVRFVLFCIAQMVGAIAASAIIYGLTPGPLSVNTFLQQGVNAAQGVFIEMFITAALVVSVLMLAAEKHSATPFAPVGIGLTLFVGHLFAVFYTGASMNTARAFGPAVVTGFAFSGQSKHWVYWVGPFLGSLLGSAFYALLKFMNYQELNPAQASTRPEDSPQAP